MRVMLMASLLSAWGCAEAVEPEEVQNNRTEPYNLIDPVEDPLTHATSTAPDAEGWTSTQIEGRQGLTFQGRSSKLISLHCDDREGVVLRHYLKPTESGLGLLGVRVGQERRRLAVNPVGEDQPVSQAILSSSDQAFLNALQSQDMMYMQIADRPTMNVPLVAPVKELVATCSKEGRP